MGAVEHQTSNLSKVPKRVRARSRSLLFSSVEAFGVQIHALDSAEVALNRSSSEGIWPTYYNLNSLAGQVISRLFTAVVASAVHEQNSLRFPVRFLLT